MKDITILGIESSCDETAAAVVVNGRDVRWLDREIGRTGLPRERLFMLAVTDGGEIFHVEKQEKKKSGKRK